ncbi:phosphatidylinositol N-acetylglucosaminyltransferase subunit Y [Coemansia spiralis]|nr:phosphatidylinositol N-acetylglucosaminyltransferase subunit Y [Coemansia spiralis]
MRLLAHEPDNTPVYGYALLALTAALFVLAMYALVVSKFMPHTGVAFLDSVKDDRYFCLLMPMTGLSFVFAVFWNWLGMKFFRHN